MHTKKRHQNMFQDLNRKLHHAEKDRESPASDSKVRNHDVIVVTHLHAHYVSGIEKTQINGKYRGNVIAKKKKKITWCENDLLKHCTT